MTRKKKTANYVGAMVVQFVPMAYSYFAHKLGMHSLDFPPRWLFVFTFVAVLIAFGQEIKTFVRGLKFKASPTGVEVDGDDGQ